MHLSIIAGSTGLVGNSILNQLCEDNYNVIAISRKPISGLRPKATELVIDFESFLIDGSLPACNHVFLCLGTTMKIAGNKNNFRRVDFDYSLDIAKKAFESGATKLTLISSGGADSSSKSFYLRVKGELEDSIIDIGFESVNIFRPGFLTGAGGRKRAVSEKIFMKFAKFLDIALIGSARKYRSINAEVLAKKMVSTLKSKPGVNYYYYDEFIK
jgi:uncharacterized protein YbjT (DUF2867 family)